MSFKLHTCDTVGAHWGCVPHSQKVTWRMHVCVCGGVEGGGWGADPRPCSSSYVNKLSGPRDNLAPTSGGTLGI